MIFFGHELLFINSQYSSFEYDNFWPRTVIYQIKNPNILALNVIFFGHELLFNK